MTTRYTPRGRSTPALLLAALAGLSACGRDAPSGPPSPANVVAVEIRYRDSFIQLTPGLAVSLRAEVRDRSGRWHSDFPVEWRSRDTTVFRVDSEGWVFGRRPGQSRLVATASGTGVAYSVEAS